jgi:hypothetical protein
MATVIDLGKAIKAKYPQYADMDDAELGRKMKEKYPQYSDYSEVSGEAPAAAPEEEGFIPGVKRVLKEGQGRMERAADYYGGGVAGKMAAPLLGAGAAIGTLGGLAFEGVKAVDKFAQPLMTKIPLTPTSAAGKKLGEGITSAAQWAAQTPVGSAALGKVGEFAKAHPMATDIGQSALDVATAIPAIKGGAAIKEAVDVATAPAKVRKAADIIYDAVRPGAGDITKLEIRKGRDLKEITGAIAQKIGKDKSLLPTIRPDGTTMDWSAAKSSFEKAIPEDAVRASEVLKDIPGNVDLNKSADKVREAIKKTVLDPSDQKQALEEVEQQLADAVEQFGDAPKLQAANELKKGKWQARYDTARGFKKKVAGLFGHEIGDAIDATAKSDVVRALNKRMSLAYDAIEVLDKASTRVTKGGRLMQYFAGLVGSTTASGAASAFDALGLPMGAAVQFAAPAVGSLVGLKAGEMLERASLVGKAKKAGSLMQKASKYGAKLPMPTP